MIVPMKKITLVVLDREREKALAELRKTGVMHVEKREASSQSMTEQKALVSRIDQATGILSDAKIGKASDDARYPGRDRVLEMIDRVFMLRDERRDALEKRVRLKNEFDLLAVWGDIDPADFSFLADRGIHLYLYAMLNTEYASLPETVRTLLVNRDRKETRFLVVNGEDRVPEDLPSTARAYGLPSRSTAAMREEYEAAGRLIPSINEQLSAIALHADWLQILKAEVNKELEFETIRAGMPEIPLVNTSVAWLTGFVPEADVHRIAESAAKNGWAFISDDPSDEDMVPTKIKNNRIVNTISPLLDFLGTVPGYRETDISMWFLLFFGIFFAMIFGDAGYGALIVIISLGLIFSTIRKKQAIPTALFMFLYLGGMTVVWGAITCTWFGIPVESTPDFLKAIALPAFSNENPESAVNIKIFCFTLGLIQISLAHVIGVIRNRKSLKILGDIGSLMLAAGMYIVVLDLVVDAEKYPITNPVIALIVSGFLINFIFVNYSGSVGGSILESLKNIISMILGVVNMFADIMSYIRLWAVGLAGAAISSTINSMAGPMFGGFVFFAGIVLLLFGHGLNSIMNVLSVLVHGVRLNTLEFSTHLGLTWSGFKYEPFAETVKK